VMLCLLRVFEEWNGKNIAEFLTVHQMLRPPGGLNFGALFLHCT
jgi:hypothetical protein